MSRRIKGRKEEIEDRRRSRSKRLTGRRRRKICSTAHPSIWQEKKIKSSKREANQKDEGCLTNEKTAMFGSGRQFEAKTKVDHYLHQADGATNNQTNLI